MASSHKSEALVTAVIIHEVILDHVVELNLTTVDSTRTEEAEASVVSVVIIAGNPGVF